jgi:hypothetical protein
MKVERRGEVTSPQQNLKRAMPHAVRVNNLQHPAGVHLAPVTGSASSELKAVQLGDPLYRYSNISSGGKSCISYSIVIPVSGPRNKSGYPIPRVEYHSDASACNRPKLAVQTQIENPPVFLCWVRGADQGGISGMRTPDLPVLRGLAASSERHFS